MAYLLCPFHVITIILYNYPLKRWCRSGLSQGHGCKGTRLCHCRPGRTAVGPSQVLGWWQQFIVVPTKTTTTTTDYLAHAAAGTCAQHPTAVWCGASTMRRATAAAAAAVAKRGDESVLWCGDVTRTLNKTVHASQVVSLNICLEEPHDVADMRHSTQNVSET